MKISIKNKGLEIEETNYFTILGTANGALFCSLNKGAFRLLIPNQISFQPTETVISEIRTGKTVEVDRVTDLGRRAVRLWFIDGSDEPYNLIVHETSMDFYPNDEWKNGFEFIAYNSKLEIVHRCPGKLVK